MGSYAIGLDNGDIDWLGRVGGCFVVGLEIVPYTEAQELLESSGVQGRR